MVMDELADGLNAESLTIMGKVDDLTVAEFDGREVVGVAQIPLI